MRRRLSGRLLVTHAAEKKPLRLLFVSPQFLFPMDAGGKIRTANILKHLKGGAFEIELLAPATDAEHVKWRNEISTICDRFQGWRPEAKLARSLRKLFSFIGAKPVSVAAETTSAARSCLAEALSRKPDLVIYDYVHSVDLAPASIDAPSLFFAHNVETEIFERHVDQARGLMKWMWSREAGKMLAFERRALSNTSGVICVSERDAKMFRERFNARFARAIPTGVDSDYFTYQAPTPTDPMTVTFTGSMDWRANQDGLAWFMGEVWPFVVKELPEAGFCVVGKNPPAHLVNEAKRRGLNWAFTGFVDDIRDYARGRVYVIPLRVGGGTRIKAFEAMAMGVPVVSTSLGVEGLGVKDGEQYLRADTAKDFAAKVVDLLRDDEKRLSLSHAARALVANQYDQQSAARAFESHCLARVQSTIGGD